MGGRSIASRAANVKQRQKIAHAGNYWHRLENENKDEEGNQLPSQEINTSKTICPHCTHIFWYKSSRCPECNREINA